MRWQSVEPVVLYKLIVLQLLKKVNFPLTNGQLSEFFTSRDYTNFLTYQEVISDLVESNLIKSDTVRNMTRYELTREGEDVLFFFGKQLSEGIAADIDSFIKENKFQMRNEVGITADYHKASHGNFMVVCKVLEDKDTLIEVKLSVPDEAQAISMCEKWKDSNQEIYSYIMKRLL